MSTISKRGLSGATHGAGILVTATSIGSGVTIHAGSSTTTEGEGDFVTLYCCNNDTADILLTLGWGGTTDPDNVIKQTIPFQKGLTLVVVDLLIRNSLVVKAAAGTGSKLVIYGEVKRIA